MSLLLGASFSLGIYIGKQNQGFMSALLQLILSLLKIALPLTALVAILFLVLLISQGVQLLWETKHASYILLTLIGMLIVMTSNSLITTTASQPNFSRITRLITNIALLTLPIYSFIAFYSVYLRINQHGLTPNRIWVGIIIVFVIIHSLFYAIGALNELRHRQRGPWLKPITRFYPQLLVITVLGLWTASLSSSLINTVSVQSQINRLLSGQVTVDDFSLYEVKHTMGGQGQEAIDTLIERATAINYPQLAELKTRVENSHDYAINTAQSIEAREKALTVYYCNRSPQPA